MPPVISIVIPSLNQGRYLDHALTSIFNQSYRDVEVLVIDGGSTDETLDVLRANHQSIAYWQSQKDEGPADALNNGFARAKGQVLGFLNADDFYLPGALEAVAAAFERSAQTDVFSGNGFFATSAGDLGAPIYSDVWNWKRFVNGACVLLQPATFFRRSAFVRAGGFRRTGRVCWDMELWADLARSGARFDILDEPIAAFRIHDQSITGGERLRQRRRTDARAVMAELKGRQETRTDRFLHLLFRTDKFCRHPLRFVRRRAFFYSTLRRWSL
jgi:glycosyltransferase involved in cell wall biosynthesis